jgi:ribonuclease D
MARLHPPDKSRLLDLPPCPGLALADIMVPRSEAEHQAAWDDLRAHRHLGFDTESRPTFVKGEESRGPDVVQFATPTRAYVLQLRHAESTALARAVLTSPHIVKVGFGLQQDRSQLRQRLGLEVQACLDLDLVFHRMGYPRSIGIKAAVAIAFGQRFVKSKRVTTTNWANARLEPRQLVYAANDAWVALQVMRWHDPASLDAVLASVMADPAALVALR